MARQLLILVAAFAGGTLVALILGAKNLGTALAVGQLTFAAVLLVVLLTDKPRG